MAVRNSRVAAPSSKPRAAHPAVAAYSSLSFAPEKSSRGGSIAWIKRNRVFLAAIMAAFVLAVAVLAAVLTTVLARPPSSTNLHRPVELATANGTADVAGVLRTWWHSTGEINFKTPVQDGNVRQSHLYDISVSPDGEHFYRSFVYETIPRNGQGNILIPGNLASTTDQDDSITIEQDLNMTMAWTSFLYGRDVTILVHRLDGRPIDARKVTLRPTTRLYPVKQSGENITIAVPFSSAGTRFSIEIADNLFSYHLSTNGPIASFVQDEDPQAFGYVPEYTSGMPINSVEPRDSLLIFANPFPTPDLIPDHTSAHVVAAGKLENLDQVNSSTLIFGQGVYFATGKALANLSSAVSWVYFAPGSYVKGAIIFNSNASVLRATGPGVLSGEQYVYQANTADGFRNNKSDLHSVRMWSGTVPSAGNGTTFLLDGPTVNAPPFNSMDFRGDVDRLSVRAARYQQVGAFFGQTDGLQAYPGSVMRHLFYHSNDDTIKTYYSNVSISDVVVWKGRTAPTIQFGWFSRNMSGVDVRRVDIIHSRYDRNDTHPAIIGANQVYLADEHNTSTADPSNLLSNVTFRDIRSEGASPSLFRIVPLSDYEGILIENVWVERWLGSDGGKNGSDNASWSAMATSHLPMWYDASGRQVSVRDFMVSGLKVGYGHGNDDDDDDDEAGVVASIIGDRLFEGLSVGGGGKFEVAKQFLEAGNVSIMLDSDERKDGAWSIEGV